MRISDWSSDVCSSDLLAAAAGGLAPLLRDPRLRGHGKCSSAARRADGKLMRVYFEADADPGLIRTRKIAILGYGNQGRPQALNLRDSGVEELRIALRPGSAGAERARADGFAVMTPDRSDEHTSELQSLMRTPLAVFCLKK